MKIAKKCVIYVLVAVIGFSSVALKYEHASRVEAVAGVDDALMLSFAGLLALYGIYVNASYDTDGSSALKPYYDEMEKEYDSNRLKLIQGGASGDPDDPNDDDFPTFKYLLTHDSQQGIVALAGQAVLCLQPSIEKMYGSLYGFGKKLSDFASSEPFDISKKDYNLSELTGLDISRGFTSYGFSNKNFLSLFNEYYDSGRLIATAFLPDNTYYLYFAPSGKKATDFLYRCKDVRFYSSLNYQSEDIKMTNFITFSPNAYNSDISQSAVGGYSGMKICLNPSLKVYFEDLNGNRIFDNEIIWTHPAIQDTYENKGTYEQPVPPTSTSWSPDLASLQRLQQVLNNPDSTPEEKTNALNDYFYDVNPEIDPTYDKDNPKPDPDPSTTNKPISEPTTSPNPTTSPSPSEKPDEGGGSSSGGGPSGASLLAQLTTLFPFCIPFDLIRCVKLFNAEPEAPKIEFPVKISILNIDEKIVFDFKNFEVVAKVSRTMFLILFIIGLILVTRNLIKG